MLVTHAIDMSRRAALTSVAAGALSLSMPASSATQSTPPYPEPGSPIRAVRVGSPTAIADSVGDTWVTAWGDDGALYSPSNDTRGFHSDALIFRLLSDLTVDQKRRIQSGDVSVWKELTAEQYAKLKREGPLSPIAFNRIDGTDPLSMDGVTVNWMHEYSQQDRGIREVVDHFGKKMKVAADARTWKSSGCTFVDRSIYWVIARQQYGEISGDTRLRQTAVGASLIKSTDYGKTWTRSAEENMAMPMFPGSQFAAPYFVDYGRDRPPVDGADRFVYAVSNNGFWDNGDRLILGRVRRDRIGLLRSEDWEFFAGFDNSHSPAWTSLASSAKPVLQAPGRLGESGVTYLPARGRYMLIGWYYPAGSGKLSGAHAHTIWDFYESPKPWGPWIKIGSRAWSPEGYYCPCICAKFQSASRVYVVTAGDYTTSTLYRFTVVPIDIA